MGVAGGVSRRYLSGAHGVPPVAPRGREHRLEPEHRPEDEQPQECRPAEVDARIAAVGGAEPLLRPRGSLHGERCHPEDERDQALQPERLASSGRLVDPAEPDEQCARGDAGHHESPPRNRGVDVLRLPHPGVVHRPEVEVREEEREVEEHRRAREQVRRRPEVARKHLGLLGLDDRVVGAVGRQLAHQVIPAGAPAGTGVGPVSP